MRSLMYSPDSTQINLHGVGSLWVQGIQAQTLPQTSADHLVMQTTNVLVKHYEA